MSPSNLEAQIEGQKYEVQSLHRDLWTTQDSPNSWDEVNFNSIQGVSVDESVAASTSSELALSHPPQAGGRPRAFSTKRVYNAESSFRIGCSSEYTTSENLDNFSGCT